MPTSSEIVRQKREREAWDAYMAGLRAQSMTPTQQQAATVEQQPASSALILGPDGQPLGKGSSNG